MQTVAETKAYIAAAKDAGLTDDDMSTVVDYLAHNPEAGDIMPGCGGCRKLRVAKGGKGKSGGYRFITFYGGARIPIYLLTVFGKGQKASLSMSERNALAQLAKILKAT